MLLVAVPLGTFAATRPRSFVDRLSLALGVAAISTHPLVVGLLLQLFVGNRWKLLPASGLLHRREAVGTASWRSRAVRTDGNARCPVAARASGRGT